MLVYFLLDYHHTEARDQFSTNQVSLTAIFLFPIVSIILYLHNISYNNVIKNALLQWSISKTRWSSHSHCSEWYSFKSTLQLSWASGSVEPKYFFSPRTLHLVSYDLATSNLLHKTIDLEKYAFWKKKLIFYLFHELE